MGQAPSERALLVSEMPQALEALAQRWPLAMPLVLALLLAQVLVTPPAKVRSFFPRSTQLPDSASPCCLLADSHC